MRGPKPQSVELKRLAGNPGRRNLRVTAPPSGEPPPPPADLTEPEQAKWGELAAAVCRDGRLPPGDSDMVAQYVRAWSRLRDAGEAIRRDGPTMFSRGAVVKSPWLAIERDAFDMMLKIADRLGLSPESRVRLGVSRGAKPDDMLAMFLATRPAGERGCAAR